MSGCDRGSGVLAVDGMTGGGMGCGEACSATCVLEYLGRRLVLGGACK